MQNLSESAQKIAEEKMKEVNEAYEILSDLKKRSIYDSEWLQRNNVTNGAHQTRRDTAYTYAHSQTTSSNTKSGATHANSSYNGNYVKGRYRSDNGNLFDESSLSIEIIGITTETLNKVAEDLAKMFKQETVLVKDYKSNRIYLVK